MNSLFNALHQNIRFNENDDTKKNNREPSIRFQISCRLDDDSSLFISIPELTTIHRFSFQRSMYLDRIRSLSPIPHS